MSEKNKELRRLLSLPSERKRELWRREAEGRVLSARQHHDGEAPWIIIANEEDWTAQSIVLTNQEYRYLYWEALGGKYNDYFWVHGESSEEVLLKVARDKHAFQAPLERERALSKGCAVCSAGPLDPRHDV